MSQLTADFNNRCQSKIFKFRSIFAFSSIRFCQKLKSIKIFGLRLVIEINNKCIQYLTQNTKGLETKTVIFQIILNCTLSRKEFIHLKFNRMTMTFELAFHLDKTYTINIGNIRIRYSNNLFLSLERAIWRRN